MKKLAVLIPAHNEEKTLPKTLLSLFFLVNPADIYLVSDASTDKTLKVAARFGINFLESRKNMGKTRVLIWGLKDFKLLDRYEFIFFLDADTRPDRDFFHQAFAGFNGSDIACVCGQVLPERKFNIFVAHRALMYFVWQEIYKKFCSKFNAIPIAPGTASVYKTSVLKKIKLDPSLVIEDFDLTFQIHRRRLGRIVYSSKAKVFTQDPDNFRDYFRQMARWQLGFLQAAKKHGVPFGRQPFEWAILLLFSQEFFHSLAIFFLILLVAWLKFFALYPSLFGFYFEKQTIFAYLVFDIWLVAGFTLLTSILSKQIFLLPFIPFLWPLQFVNIATFAKALYMILFKSISGAWISPKRWAKKLS